MDFIFRVEEKIHYLIQNPLHKLAQASQNEAGYNATYYYDADAGQAYARMSSDNVLFIDSHGNAGRNCIYK